MSSYDAVLARLEHVTGSPAKGANGSRSSRCPAHPDRDPSLTVTHGDDGRTLLKCHAGCAPEAVVAALGLTMADLFEQDQPAKQQPRTVARYPYVDEQGELLYTVERLEPGFDGKRKSFVQRPASGKRGAGAMAGVPLVLYRLPAVLAAIATGEPVMVVEGEKDVEAAERAGVVATTCPMGAGSWKPTYTEMLRGADVVIVADADAAGRAHAASIALALEGVAADVRCAEPRHGKDLSEHLAAGLTVEELNLVEDRWTSTAEPVPPLEVPPVEHAATSRLRVVDGGEFVRAANASVPAMWGDGQTIAWAKGESLLIAAPTGVGKTTTGQQLMLARLGIRPPHLLGLPVAVEHELPLLYIAADRPAQAARSLARMVNPEDHQLLQERLIVWKGPPPCNILKDPESLSIFVQEMGAGTVLIDSLKDIVPDLSKDETGSRYNIARQHVLAAGIDLVELHHQRKARSDGGKPKHLDDVYGSTWITAGAGSVFVLWGEAGDLIVELLHLKQPLEIYGPHKIRHDHSTGTTTLDNPVDLVALLSAAPRGISARLAASALYEKTEPTRNDIEKARRRLEGLCKAGHAHRRDGTKGGSAGGENTVYLAGPDLSEMVA